MSDSPAWLTEPDTPAAAPTTQPDPLSYPPNNAPTDSGPSTAVDGAATENPDLPGIILTMRLANMGVSIGLVVWSIFVMISLSSFSVIVLSAYAALGGLLICCLETQLKFLRVMIAVNFGFLFNSVWRFIFYLILATIELSFRHIVGYILGVSLIVVSFYNMYVLCRYPEYRKIREKIAEEEDKRIENRISKEVKRQVANQITK